MASPSISGKTGVTFRMTTCAGLQELVHVKLNLEMAATDAMVDIACEVRPNLVMLVPEGREEITTEGGLDIARRRNAIKDAVHRLRSAGLVVSAFIDAEPLQIEAAAACGFSVCEVHTGPYAHAFHEFGRDARSPEVVAELEKIDRAGELIRQLGMRFMPATP